jgi:hypothetical protein
VSFDLFPALNGFYLGSQCIATPGEIIKLHRTHLVSIFKPDELVPDFCQFCFSISWSSRFFSGRALKRPDQFCTDLINGNNMGKIDMVVGLATTPDKPVSAAWTVSLSPQGCTTKGAFSKPVNWLLPRPR